MGSPSLASEFPNDNAEISSGAVWICQNLTGPASLQAPPFQPVPAVPFVFWFDDEDPASDGPANLQITNTGIAVHVLDAAPSTRLLETKPAAAQLEPVVADPEPVVADLEPAVAEAGPVVAVAGPVVAVAGPVVADLQPVVAVAGPVVADLEPVVAEAAPLIAEGEAPFLADADAPVMIKPSPETLAAPAFAHFEQALSATLMAQSASRAAAVLPKMLRLEALPGDALTKDVQLTLQSRGYLDSSGRYSPKFRDLCGAWTAVLQGSSQDFAACGTTTLDRFGADLLAALLAVPATRSDDLRRELRKAGIAAFGILEATAA